YSWAPGTGLSSTGGAVVTATPNSTTTYICFATDTFGCKNMDTVMVTVNPYPVISITPTAPVICTGDSVLLTANGATNYSWSPATGLSSTTGATVIASPATATTYTITGTDANGCKNTASITVTINPPPIADAGPDTTVCSGSGIQLNPSGGVGYLWGPSTGL